MIAMAALASLLFTPQVDAGPPPVALDSCDGRGEGALRVVELERDGAKLVLFGARHRTEAGAPVLLDLERRVAAFSPTLILVEGESAGAAPDQATAIAHGGEDGLLCWLAGQRGIPCQSMDLPEAEEARRLALRHSREEVLLFMTVRVLAYFNPRPPDQRPPGDLVAWAIRRYAPLAGLPLTTTGADLGRVCERALKRAWNPAAVTTDWHDPTKDELLTQRMSRESNQLREPHMLDQLRLAARPGSRVFAAVGEGHVCNVRTALGGR